MQMGSDLDDLADLPGLGRVSARMLIEAGVADVTALRGLGAIECYRRLRFRHGRRVTTNFLYALECAILGIDWRQLAPDRKSRLRTEARSIQDALAGNSAGRGKRRRAEAP